MRKHSTRLRPKAFASNNERLMAATAKTGRDVRIYALFMVIAAETDEEAMEKWIWYREGVDEEAIAWLGLQGAVVGPIVLCTLLVPLTLYSQHARSS